MILRIPVAIAVNLVLRIVLYARYSTDDQNPRSIADQLHFLQKLLKERNIVGQILTYSDEGISGEIISRPGIDQVTHLITNGKVDLLLAEESSRLFRNLGASCDLFDKAVDAGIRIVCPNDDIDTAEDDWEDRLYDAQRQHVNANRFTRKRIKRALDSRWDLGQAVGPLRPGYRRRAVNPATGRLPERGPYVDEINHDWAPTIGEAFERVARGATPEEIAPWLTEKGLPKCRVTSQRKWTAANVIALIRRTLYRGLEEHQRTISKKKRRTGRCDVLPNEDDKVKRRRMEHLRIVSDVIWHRANDQITERAGKRKGKAGKNHPLRNIPRRSRGPLSEIFICGVCGDKMYAAGRKGGGYQCSNARNRGGCWNRATAIRGLVHGAISFELIARLRSLEGVEQRLHEKVKSLMLDDEPRLAKIRRLRAEEQAVQRRLERMAVAIETSDEPPEILVRQLVEREQEIKRIRTEIEYEEGNISALGTPPSSEEIRRVIDETVGVLFDFSFEANAGLRRLLVGPIRAVPYRPFVGDGLIVLRAEFRLNLVPLAGPGFDHANLDESATDRVLAPHDFLVDLFKPNKCLSSARKAFELHDRQKKGCKEIGRELHISTSRAHVAWKVGEAMAAAGVVDPYVRVESAPLNASRWKISGQPNDADASQRDSAA